MSATKILIGFLLVAVVVILLGNAAVAKPSLPLNAASATLKTSNISVNLNQLLNSKGFRAGYDINLNAEPEPPTYTTSTGKKFVLARGRRCTTMTSFA